MASERKLVAIVASTADARARQLAAGLEHVDARVLTPADLSCRGWEFRPGDRDGAAVIDGAVVATDAVAAVLVRLPWVGEHELPHIDAADRAYVATEMNAFLLAWLSELPCPVVNRPSTTCLAGPLWRGERWIRAATSVGLEVSSPALEVTDAAVTATVVRDRCVGVDDPSVVARLARLARLAGAEVLTVQLVEAAPEMYFVSAAPWPDIADPDVLDAVLNVAGISRDRTSMVPAA